MGILLGLAAAILYGTSDFGGGMMARRIGSVRTNVFAAASATAIVWIALIMTGGPGPDVKVVAWGLASGFGGGIGALALYRGLARGQMSVVGPVSAVGAAAVPVVAGILFGERPGPVTTAGLVLAMPAIALVAASGSGVRGKLGVGLTDGLVAGVGFGVMFIGLARAGQHAGLWPVALEQTSALLLFLVLAVKSGESLRVGMHAAGPSLLVGVSGIAATLLFFFATHVSMLATAAVLVSLYPGVTVLLARMILHERFSLAQRAGLGMCTLAVVAIAIN